MYQCIFWINSDNKWLEQDMSLLANLANNDRITVGKTRLAVLSSFSKWLPELLRK